MGGSVRHGARLAVVLFLTVATVHADDLHDMSMLAAIESELQTILDSLGAERRKPLAEQDATKIPDLLRHVDGVRQRLAQLDPVSPILRARKTNVEADLDRLTYLVNDMWRALQAPELVAARRLKEEARRKAEEAQEQARQRIAAVLSKLAEFEKERAQEASRPLGQQRRAVYERLLADASAVSEELNRRWDEGRESWVLEVRGSLWKYLGHVRADVSKLDVHEHTQRMEREAKAREQARQQEAARREQARRVSIRAKGWNKATEEAVIERKILLGMTPEQVREAWGAPEQINRTLTRHGEHEQWVYGIGQYVYFENGRLSSIQTSESPRR